MLGQSVRRVSAIEALSLGVEGVAGLLDSCAERLAMASSSAFRTPVVLMSPINETSGHAHIGHARSPARQYNRWTMSGKRARLWG